VSSIKNRACAAVVVIQLGVRSLHELFFLNIYDIITINYISNDQIVDVNKSATSLSP